ncbi:PREDICTED: migration and invasion-inhibitory protein isoform X3 [Dipodomys ordii]|uniref:Migration and invasion-inhibitory protein isoform X3 n=1 Tax=Dipodomys ordii TaxID=10020 RepID=A0A1S3GEE9_DIPOR|nr:PREDICTED: migration and invasion-inhibitory protein isoform X3 [Dipodomys ordii]
MPRLELGAVPGLGETKDLEQLRLLNLELLKQLWIGQEAVQRSVAKAFAKSGLDCPRRYNSEIPMYPDTSLASPSTSGSRDRGQEKDTEDALGDDPHKRAWLGRASSRAASLPPAKYQRPESLDVPRFRSASLPVPREWKEPAPLAGPGDLELPKAQTPRSRRSKPFKPTVTFGQGTAVPERSWRLRPYLGYDWIAGSLDSASHITDEPEAFFSTLQKFREANKEECIHGYTEVSVPLSILDPPHQYHIHRRKSYDSSDTLALPRHCLLGWGSLPPTSERRSAPQSLDLWSSVSSKAQHRTLSATTPSYLTLRAPPSTPVWSEP